MIRVKVIDHKEPYVKVMMYSEGTSGVVSLTQIPIIMHEEDWEFLANVFLAGCANVVAATKARGTPNCFASIIEEVQMYSPREGGHPMDDIQELFDAMTRTDNEVTELRRLHD